MNQLDRQQISERIKKIRGKLTQAEFAERLSVKQTYISKYEKGALPEANILVRIAKFGNISVERLLTGEGPLIGEKEPVYQICEAVPEVKYGHDVFVYVPMVRGEISASGGLLPDNTVEIKLAFRQDWLERKGDPHNMSLIRVTGDSMEPTLYSGDIVLVDHNRNYFDPQGGIYAICLDKQIMIKRLQVIYPSKKVLIVSDNKDKYKAFEIEPKNVTINGKIIWFGREIER